MILLDIVFWGWYQILDKTIYLFVSDKESFGPKEHSFFIGFLIHGVNVWTAFSYLFITCCNQNVNIYFSISIAIVIFIAGYLIYFKKGRVKKVVNMDVSMYEGAMFLILTLIYAIISVFLMLEVGNYIRFILNPELG